ncbi:MAG: YcaO-like family protein [Proteobacteria bacterium]|nr:YcaO-like family protein [Pseudomonadota bacterium]
MIDQASTSLAERSCDHHCANRIIYQWLDREGIKAKVVFNNPEYQVGYINLYDHKDRLIIGGGGKGDTYLLSALAEAMEHYHLLKHSLQDKTKTGHNFQYISTQDIYKQESLKKCGIMRSLKDYPSQKLAAYDYYEFAKHTSYTAFIPALFTNPLFLTHSKDNASQSLYNESSQSNFNEAESFLCRYAYSTGTSFGITLEDALLHCLNENIERHYLSCYYLHLINQKTSIRFQEIPLNNLKSQLHHKANFVDFMDNNYRWKVIVASNPAMADLKFCLVVGSPLKQEASTASLSFSNIGVGLSLYGDIALHRAIGEFCQSHFLKNAQQTKKDLDIAQFLSKSALHPLIDLSRKQLPQTPLADFIKPSKQAIKPLFNNQSYLRPHQQLSLISELLYQSGYKVLYHLLSKPYDPFIVASLIVPGLERFHLIREGIIVAPQASLNT